MKFRTADQQFRYFGMIPAPDIAVHGMNKIFLDVYKRQLICYKRVHAIWKISCLKKERISEIVSFSMLTCIQQSVMNLGILMVQGLVNSFGTVVMAAFAAAVKIDAFAYMPVQDFGNAFSTFIAQNYGAKEKQRIQHGLKAAVCILSLIHI